MRINLVDFFWIAAISLVVITGLYTILIPMALFAIFAIAAARSSTFSMPTDSRTSPPPGNRISMNCVLTVTGTNFRTGGTITVQGSGITVGTVTVSSDTSLTVLLSATASAARPRKIVRWKRRLA